MQKARVILPPFYVLETTTAILFAQEPKLLITCLGL